MGRQLNRVVSNSPAIDKASGLGLRHRLALTTILATAPFFAYGRMAYAACNTAGAPTVICDGSIGGFSFTDDNLHVSTDGNPPFVVTTTGVAIDGNGHIQFIDKHPSSITNTVAGEPGLSVRSNGDDGGIRGAVTIITDADISGAGHGIEAYNAGSGDIQLTANGEVTGNGDNGINAENASTSGGIRITTGAHSVVRGADTGIRGINRGDGDLVIEANGKAYGTLDHGILALSAGRDLMVTTGAQSVISGGINGIVAENEGLGDLVIDVRGDVTGDTGDGIRARNPLDLYGDYSGALRVTTGAGSRVIGGGYGIDARNNGIGALEIIANGVVTGKGLDGIQALNLFSAGDLRITTGASSQVTGRENGTKAVNFGDGDLVVSVDGMLNGETEDGIHALNVDGTYTYNGGSYTGRGDNLTITTGRRSIVTGADDGIEALNHGSGYLKIAVDGTLAGNGADGIEAVNSGTDLEITTGRASAVTGDSDGIDATNDGSGHLKIIADGTIFGKGTLGSGTGIEADNEGTYLTIITGARSNIEGATYGIEADNDGSGDLTIEANGRVAGGSQDGIYADNDGRDLIVTTGVGSVITGRDDDGIAAAHDGTGALRITVNGLVSGRGEVPGAMNHGYGIEAVNEGGGDTYVGIGATGIVEGRYAGVFALSDSGQAISITNDGLVRNLSGASHDIAIVADGGAAEIVNNGDLIGAVITGRYSGHDDILENAGFWNTAGGASNFGQGNDEVHNTGTLLAADDPTTPENTSIGFLETFHNDGGVISLVDGQAGDELFLFGLVFGAIEYKGTNGRLAVDAVLGPSGTADELLIDGDSSGTTLVHVNVLDAVGPNFDGIRVVKIRFGTTEEDDFDLDGPLYAGFFTWDLIRTEADEHRLYTTGIGAGSYEFAAGISGVQEVWHQTNGTILQRQADLRSLLDGMSVTPVADYAEPVEPTPFARITPGFWFRAVGAYIDRDDSENDVPLDREQTIWGGMAGFDFGTQDGGDALMFGVFGGYLASDLDFDETHSEWRYEGPTVGAYATYLNHGLHVDATVKADFLDIDIDPEDLAQLADDADTDAINIGGRLDAGYKFGQAMFVEPQATLAVVHTEIDDVDMFGGTVEFDDATSIRGRLGVRLGYEQVESDGMRYSGDVTASVWEDFSGDNDVAILDSGVPDYGVAVDPGQTYGDISLGFNILAPDGWSGFIRGNYLFADDYDAVTGNAGLRYAF